MYLFPAGSRLAQGRALVVANTSSAFSAAHGFQPAFEPRERDPGVPNLACYGAWASGSVVLVNSGDEVLLLDGRDEVIDAVSWGSSIFAFAPPAGDVGPRHSLERAPACRDRDQAADWVDQPSPLPDPGRGKPALVPASAPAPHPRPAVQKPKSSLPRGQHQ